MDAQEQIWAEFEAWALSRIEAIQIIQFWHALYLKNIVALYSAISKRRSLVILQCPAKAGRTGTGPVPIFMTVATLTETICHEGGHTICMCTSLALPQAQCLYVHVTCLATNSVFVCARHLPCHELSVCMCTSLALTNSVFVCACHLP
jgi:hypothetical protein